MTKIRQGDRRLLDKYECISFDLFDTLIGRDTAVPKQVFQLAARRARQLQGIAVEPLEFMRRRLEAERFAREKKQGEVELDEIYLELAAEYSEDELKILKESEIQSEIDMSHAIPEGFDLYREAMALKKRVILISDMYLPGDVLREILRKCGYHGYHALYVSCEMKKTKGKGDLYEEVAKMEGISPKRILHIGDNWKVDHLRAVMHGYHAKWLRRHGKADAAGNVDDSLISSALSEMRKKEEDVFFRVGVRDFGPCLYGFLQWLHDCVTREGCEAILFLSRDGYFMKKAYEEMYTQDGIPVHYFMASRRALQVAALHLDPSYEHVTDSMFIPKHVTMAWLLRRWGIPKEEYQAALAGTEISLETVFEGAAIRNNPMVKEVFQRNLQKILTNSEREYNAFLQYWKSFSLKGKIALVDIGWYGNMQCCLEKLLCHGKAEGELRGYYFGVVPSSRLQNLQSMSGYLFQREKNEKLYETARYMCSLLELCFMAPHGSTLRYGMDGDGRAVAEREPFEFAGTETLKNMQALQRGAMDFIRAYRKNIAYTVPKETVYFSGFYHHFCRPDRKLAENFGELELMEDGRRKVAEKVPFCKGILSPRKTMKQFADSSWKMGFLKRMLLCDIPYDRLVLTLRKHYHSHTRDE